MLGEKDVLKVDFGVHVKGRILDSAFTLNFDPTYDKLLEAVKAATDTGVRVSVSRVPTLGRIVGRKCEQICCILRVAKVIANHKHGELALATDWQGPRAERTVRYGLFSAFVVASVPKRTAHSRVG